jgi:polyamine oxidase
MMILFWAATYDNTGAVDYLNVFNTAVDDLVNLITKAGALSDNYLTRQELNLVDERAAKQLVDITARAAYGLVGAKPQDAHAKAAEYFQVLDLTT